MIDEMNENEIDRLLKVTSFVQYAVVKNPQERLLVKKVLDDCKDEDDFRWGGTYLFNLGQIMERLHKSFGEEDINLPDFDFDNLVKIIENNNNESASSVGDMLFHYILEIQRKSFRYGYYAAIETELSNF